MLEHYTLNINECLIQSSISIRHIAIHHNHAPQQQNKMPPKTRPIDNQGQVTQSINLLDRPASKSTHILWPAHVRLKKLAHVN